MPASKKVKPSQFTSICVAPKEAVKLTITPVDQDETAATEVKRSVNALRGISKAELVSKGSRECNDPGVTASSGDI
jgi:hypothetical protein